MTRYLAISWNTGDSRACAIAKRVSALLSHESSIWKVAMSEDDFILVVALPLNSRRAPFVRLKPSTGIVLGSLFDRHPISLHARSGFFTERESVDISNSNGRILISSFWGSYVLFLRPAGASVVYVLRGPMSQVPCYFTSIGSAHVIFSDMEDCFALGLRSYSINWDRVRAQASMLDFLNGETSLNEVFALESGSCLSLTKEHIEQNSYWKPSPLWWGSQIDSFEDSARLFRETICSCSAALASRHNSVLIQLSGGLDSSIVVASLAAAQPLPQLTCVNYHSPGSGDERRFARSMASKAGVRLIERERNSHVDLRMFLNCSRTAGPILNFSACDTEPSNAEIMREVGATANFNGELGDNIFGSGIQHEVLEEYVREHGINSDFFSLAMEFAILRKVSVWQALYRGLWDGLFRRRLESWSVDKYLGTIDPNANDLLVSDSALRASRANSARFVHPWFKDIHTIPCGKLQLMYGLQLITSTCCESPFSQRDAPPTISPLCAQPVVELALATPTHFHFRNAINRAVARHAFATDLTEAVLNRGTAKGGPQLWVEDLVARNREWLREIFLDGVLVREQVLDKRRIERLLGTSVKKTSLRATDVLVQLYIEVWARKWSVRVAHADS